MLALFNFISLPTVSASPRSRARLLGSHARLFERRGLHGEHRSGFILLYNNVFFITTTSVSTAMIPSQTLP